MGSCTGFHVRTAPWHILTDSYQIGQSGRSLACSLNKGAQESGPEWRSGQLCLGRACLAAVWLLVVLMHLLTSGLIASLQQYNYCVY